MTKWAHITNIIVLGAATFSALAGNVGIAVAGLAVYLVGKELFPAEKVD